MAWCVGFYFAFFLFFFLTGKQIPSVPSICRTTYKQLTNVFWFGLLKKVGVIYYTVFSAFFLTYQIWEL